MREKKLLIKKERKKEKEKYRAVIQSIEKHIISAFTVLFVTDSTYRWETWNVLFIQQIKTSAWIHICIWMNSWSHNRIQDTRATELKMAS